MVSVDPQNVVVLLSLGDSLEDTLEEDDDNALLMPIGGANNPEDIAPQPIRLDRNSVDNTIAELVETEELKKSTEEERMNPTVTLPAPTDQLQPSTDPPPVVQPPDVSANTKKGSLITKTYELKKPAVKGSFKCSECNTVKQTIQKLNEHHREKHNPQMCESAIEHLSWLQVWLITCMSMKIKDSNVILVTIRHTLRVS